MILFPILALVEDLEMISAILEALEGVLEEASEEVLETLGALEEG